MNPQDTVRLSTVKIRAWDRGRPTRRRENLVRRSSALARRLLTGAVTVVVLGILQVLVTAAMWFLTGFRPA